MKTSSRWFLALLFAVSCHALVRGGEPSAPATKSAGQTPGVFKLLTWNIQMLPTFPSVPQLNKKQALRAPWIVEFLNAQDYDVVVLQEVIDKKMTQLLKAGLKEKFPHLVSVDAKQGLSGCSGGILFASKIPIQYVDHIVYKHVSGVDALAEKGCVLVAGELHGRKFQIAGTHLQAGDPAMNAKEVGEIFEGIIKPHRTAGVPQILTGDMNIAKGTDRYQTLLATNEMSDFPLDDPSPYTTDGLNSWNRGDKHAAHIDHVLLNPRGTKTTIRRQTVQRARRDHEGKPMDLADHYGVVAEVVLK